MGKPRTRSRSRRFRGFSHRAKEAGPAQAGPASLFDYLHKLLPRLFWRFAHTPPHEASVLFTQLEGHGGDGNGVADARKNAGGLVMGIEGLFALVAFLSVGFIWAIAPDKAES